jgi:ferredoxin
MTNQTCMISFPNSNHNPLTLKQNAQLAEHLTLQNSPVLFGCRTGICGTCLVLISGEIPPPDAAEKEILELLALGYSQARLACQIQLTNDIKITPFGNYEI